MSLFLPVWSSICRPVFVDTPVIYVHLEDYIKFAAVQIKRHEPRAQSARGRHPSALYSTLFVCSNTRVSLSLQSVALITNVCTSAAAKTNTVTKGMKDGPGGVCICQ